MATCKECVCKYVCKSSSFILLPTTDLFFPSRVMQIRYRCLSSWNSAQNWKIPLNILRCIFPSFTGLFFSPKNPSRLQVQDFFFFDTTAKQVREHMSTAIRSSTTRGYVGKDITQARGQNSVILSRFYGKRQTCTMWPCFPFTCRSLCFYNNFVSG